MKKYTKTHEWIEIADGKVAKVGITNHAQEELRDIVFIELPKSGAQLTQGVACAVVESVKAAFDIYSPVSGKVVDANSAVEDDPAIANESPETDGWFFTIELSDMGELDNLLEEDAYNKLVAEGGAH